MPLVSVLQEEAGVSKERERIYSLEGHETDSIVIKDLQKHYRSKGRSAHTLKTKVGG